MKKILLLGALMLLSVCRIIAQSPITLVKNNFPLSPGPFHYAQVNPKTVIPPKNGQNMAWDYSGLIKDTDFIQQYQIVFHNPFSGSKIALADTGIHEFLTSNNDFSETNFFDEDSNGFYFSGDTVPEQGLSLKNYFNNPSDSIYIPEQNDSLRLNIVNFPTVFGKGYHQKTIKSLIFFWTVKSANLDSAISFKKTYYSVSDTVTGWGTLRVPAAGKKSIPYPVLLVRRKSIVIDSYFVNGSPPSKFFLVAFGIVQGHKTIDCNEYFYRAGYQNPLMTLLYGADINYSSPIGVLYSMDSIKQQAGIEQDNDGGHNFSLYPNPANGNQVRCSFTKGSTRQWKMLIMNSLGQIFRSETIQGNGKINMSLDITGAKAGLYFVNIVGEDGQGVANAKLNIIR